MEKNVPTNTRSRQLMIVFQKRMSEVRNVEQKGDKHIYSEIFYGGQELHEYFCSSTGYLYGLVKWMELTRHTFRKRLTGHTS